MRALSRRSVIAAAAATCFVQRAFAQTPLGAGVTRNHPDIDAALVELQNRQWSDLATRTASLSAQSALVLLDDLSNAVAIDANLSGLGRVPDGDTLLGALRIGIAWRHRGAGDGETVTERGFREFLRYLEAGERSLRAAIRNDPNDGLACALLFRAYKGLEDRTALEAVLPTFASASRKPVGGLSLYMDAISAKWLGSESEALAFGRAQAGAAPPASYGLIPDTHLTCAVGRLMSEDASVQASGVTYLQQETVRNEITVAHDNFIAGPAEQDVLTAQYAHAAFSFAFFELRDAPRLRQHLIGLGAYRGGPWGMVENPDQTIAQLRRALGLSNT